MTAEQILTPYLLIDISQTLVTKTFKTPICNIPSLRYYSEPYNFHLHKFFKELFNLFNKANQDALLDRMDEFESYIASDMDKLVQEIYTVLSSLNTENVDEEYLMVISQLHGNSAILQIAKNCLKALGQKNHRINDMIALNTSILNHLPINIVADLNTFESVTTQLNQILIQIKNYKFKNE